MATDRAFSGVSPFANIKPSPVVCENEWFACPCRKTRVGYWTWNAWLALRPCESTVFFRSVLLIWLRVSRSSEWNLRSEWNLLWLWQDLFVCQHSHYASPRIHTRWLQRCTSWIKGDTSVRGGLHEGGNHGRLFCIDFFCNNNDEVFLKSLVKFTLHWFYAHGDSLVSV